MTVTLPKMLMEGLLAIYGAKKKKNKKSKKQRDYEKRVRQ